MTFRVAQESLERLEWPRLVARLQVHCRTPQAHDRLAHEMRGETSDFEPTLAGARERLAETSEARALLDADELPPLGGVSELDEVLARSEKGGALDPQQLILVRSTLSAVHATLRFLRQRRDAAPRLADLADTALEQRDLETEIEACIDPSGEVRDSASATLREARAETNQLGAQLQKRLERYLRNPDVRAYLSDDYYTVRGDRYVLPVRADARGHVRGIVHDASSSGATLFIEPEGTVELNNRLKQAELEVAREVRRVLRELTERVAACAPDLRAALATLTRIDLAFARGRLSQEMDAVEPAIERDGVFDLKQLRHPLLPQEEAVPNDLRLGGDFTVLLLSGPNAGGKTVAMKALGLAALCGRAGMHVPAAPGARVPLVDEILADIGDDQDIRESLSTFSAHMANLAQIVRVATEHTLVVLDEVGTGTDPSEGAAIAQAALELLAESNARVVATTHYGLLKEMAATDDRFCNASVEFDPETLAPTYRLHLGTPGVSSATAVAARMGMQSEVLDRANALLDREDRRLDRMLAELAASRAALESEKNAAAALRAEGEAVRDEYRHKLERLQERRDKLFRAMRDDLDQAFRDAHGQVAAVIRDLQRGGPATTARDAAQARERLEGLEARAREAETEAGVHERPPADAPGELDWRKAKAGISVTVPGGNAGTLESLPDRRGRVRVRVGSAQLVVAADKVRAGDPTSNETLGRPRPEEKRVTHAAHDTLGGGTIHCDLRGLRVEEALDQLTEVLDRGTAERRDALHVIHGVGTGALRKAVREHLHASPHVESFRGGERGEGGDGVTLASLRGG